MDWEEETIMNQHRQGFNIFGQWFTVFEVRVISRMAQSFHLFAGSVGISNAHPLVI